MDEQTKGQEQNEDRAQEQDGSLKNSDKHGHWFRASQNDTDAGEDSVAKTEGNDSGQQQQPGGNSTISS